MDKQPLELNQGEDVKKGPNVTVITHKGLAIDPKRYEYDDKFKPATNIQEAHTTMEMINYLKTDKNTELEARVVCREKDGKFQYRTVGKEKFLEAWEKSNEISQQEVKTAFRLKETFDSFAYGGGANAQGDGNLIGQDYVPLLSGPYYKQLYYYDYLKMHAYAFQQYNHNPLARRIIHVIRDFVLGRGYRVDCKNDKGLAIWRAFEEANKLQQRMFDILTEWLIYGEQMIWWLPGNETMIGQQDAPGQQPSKGIIPRIRQIDPSVIWEIVTYPEDIERVLYYQWVAPTQYQMYTGNDAGQPVPGMKFIWQQIPADQIQHFKLNAVSNEKRGRSVLFPILGDLKRLNDTLDYGIVTIQKNAAWSIDTTIAGSPTDIQQYVDSQQQMGTIPQAGSEFVHTDAITREYKGNEHLSGGKTSDIFDWILTKIAAGSGIPTNYLNAHTSATSTRASALVATEPVTKLFEYYQVRCEHLIKAMWKKLAETSGIDDLQEVDIEVTFPELVSQDTASKIDNLVTAEANLWITKERAATMAAKELNITEYEYEEEKQEIDIQGVINPLSAPGAVATGIGGGGDNSGGGTTGPGLQDDKEAPEDKKPSAVTKDEKKDIAKRNT